MIHGHCKVWLYFGPLTFLQGQIRSKFHKFLLITYWQHLGNNIAIRGLRISKVIYIQISLDLFPSDLISTLHIYVSLSGWPKICYFYCLHILKIYWKTTKKTKYEYFLKINGYMKLYKIQHCSLKVIIVQSDLAWQTFTLSVCFFLCWFL